ncbi:hypothetical protein [Lysinibacillus sp. Ag94]|nr:hypothetical protein [Lysinibacillus sp. Ag94]
MVYGKSKTDGATTYNYYYDGSNLVRVQMRTKKRFGRFLGTTAK